ncbi:SGNH/GDSL hydrolase family protein [Amycolatopsis sp. PS_44_ISF1]|uniref:SGNH/GDSL hydrolase family protein n=1 Tax=Amycolatopsis sp. PS_44_ISF1 TaxID=2974917 RepID=UPI0028DE12B7|nr:SGNH/GDSL hydrolase family protein [Amycolatopsis sp. PS_44_ISF1]MDT8910191.1 SGNH/GDSL hydrolase family protein [Amycolatopsis sp. PS_44_ISF1]MDT8916386.1 SGNH/GDSL hydrolase family protein [Amycolatopsis sp. PS_44_ISF1]MDT8916388.1 SGNH/GDSL hydrolase family protein [Amycolatopsis sp. PS_44_ISF1]
MALLPFLLVAPLLVVQAVRVRRSTPQLPAAAGPVEGVVGHGAVLRLAVLGESTVDGVGAATHEEALTGQLARQLAERLGRRVQWQAVGRTGANARVVRRDLVPKLKPADLLVIVLGVNDTLELHSAARFRRDLLGVVVAARRRVGPAVPVLVAGVPPMARFPALPRPLRDLLAARSGALDRAAAELIGLPAVDHARMDPALLDEGTFAVDRFHPGPAGYRSWAGALAEVAERLLSVTDRRHP